MVLVVKNLPTKRDMGPIPGSGRSPGGGHGNPLQYFCLENPMDRGYSPQGPKESYRPEVTEHTHSLKGGQARKPKSRENNPGYYGVPPSGS